MYELVVYWINGDTNIYEYDDRRKAEKAGNGMEMAFGNQIQWCGVRPKINRPHIDIEKVKVIS